MLSHKLFIAVDKYKYTALVIHSCARYDFAVLIAVDTPPRSTRLCQPDRVDHKCFRFSFVTVELQLRYYSVVPIAVNMPRWRYTFAPGYVLALLIVADAAVVMAVSSRNAFVFDFDAVEIATPRC